NLIGAEEWKRQSSRLPAAIRVQHDITREQREQAVHIATARRLVKAFEQLRMLPSRCSEAGTRQMNVLLGTAQELPAVGFGQAQRRRDFGMLVVEDLVQQKDRTLLRRQPFQQEQ